MVLDVDSPQRAATSFLTSNNKENRHNSAAVSDIFTKFGVLVAMDGSQRP